MLVHMTPCLQMDNIVTVDTSGEWNACKNDAGSCTKEQLSTIQGRIWLSTDVCSVAI
jgi:hypothetical protein